LCYFVVALVGLERASSTTKFANGILAFQKTFGNNSP
jgi:hypothetical protein